MAVEIIIFVITLIMVGFTIYFFMIDCKCKNNGICNRLTKKCKCPDGWKGDKCDIKSDCCGNGDLKDGKCICSKGYFGDGCNQCGNGWILSKTDNDFICIQK